MPRRAYGEYPSNVSDEEWAFCAPYLTLMREDAPQREYPLRDVFNALRWFVRADCPWRQMPNDLPPWWVVQQQCQRWMVAGVFELMAQDLRALLRELLHGRKPEPTAAILDSRTVQSTPESGSRAGYDGYKRRKGSKIHAAVDTLGHLLALHVTPANEQDRDQVGKLAATIQERTGESVEIAYVDQGYTVRGEVGRGQTRLRASAQALGGGTKLRVGVQISTAGKRLRKVGIDAGRLSLACLCLPHARSAPQFMTGSKPRQQKRCAQR